MRKVVFKRIGWAIFIFLTIYFIFLIRRDIIDNLGLKKETAGIEKKIAVAEKHSRGLTDRSSQLKELDLIEELARTKLGMIKKGETAFKVID